jgi:hypothetical protein
LEFNTPLRIKFVSKDENGNPARDAYYEYRDLFSKQVTVVSPLLNPYLIFL